VVLARREFSGFPNMNKDNAPGRGSRALGDPREVQEEGVPANPKPRQ
jgi:hypothetical protein